MLAPLTERWVHDDAIESFLAQFDKGKATGGIFRKERIFVTFFLTQSGRKLLQRSLQTLCDFLKKLILMVAQLCTNLIGSRNLSTALLRIKDIGITILVHLTPVLAQVFDIIADFLFHLKEQTSLAHIFHLIPNGGKQTLHRLVKLIHQTFEQTLIARHSLSQHQIASGYQRTLGCIKVHLAITLLRTEPKAEGGNLQGTRIYLAAIDVILQYQSWHLTVEGFTSVNLPELLQQ